jgi:hypothetical protein
LFDGADVLLFFCVRRCWGESEARAEAADVGWLGTAAGVLDERVGEFDDLEVVEAINKKR